MGIIAGYMVPHPPIAVHEIGHGEEMKIQDTLDGFDAVSNDLARLKPDTIIITSPHQVMYKDYFHISPGKGASGDFSRFRAPSVRINVSYDDDLSLRICDICNEEGFPAGYQGELDASLDHGTMVPLYFINKRYNNARIIRIGLSGLSLDEHWQLGRIIDRAVNDLSRKCVFIASGDLSHCQLEQGPYGYKIEGPAYDERLMKVMEKGDFEKLLTFNEAFLSKAEECGHRSFTIMGGALENKNISAKMLSHEATFGVGYGICIYNVN